MIKMVGENTARLKPSVALHETERLDLVCSRWMRSWANLALFSTGTNLFQRTIQDRIKIDHLRY